MNYERIYNNLISKRKETPSEEEYTEVHHILPRWLGGTESKENLVRLSVREHYVAHLCLWKIHKDTSSLMACLAMFPRITTSKEVSAFRSALYSKRRGMVWVNGCMWISAEEYHSNKHQYSVAASGKVTCIDTVTSECVSIPVDMFYSNPSRFVVTKKDRRQRYTKDGESKLFKPEEVPDGWVHWRTGSAPSNKGVPSGKVPVINLETKEKELISKDEYNKLKGVRYVHVTAFSKKSPTPGMVRVYFIETGETGSVSKEEYNKNKGTKYIHASQVKRMKEKGLI